MLTMTNIYSYQNFYFNKHLWHITTHVRLIIANNSVKRFGRNPWNNFFYK